MTRSLATDRTTSDRAANVRVCIVGGGSPNWTPTLLQDFAATPGLTGDIILHDLDHAAAITMSELGQRLMAAVDAPFTVAAEPALEAALRGADYVIVTITTGGLAAMRHDLEIPARYGIAQSVGDTVGPGGLSRALRNVPVFAALAATMERVCPDAWLLNLTNPMSACVLAVTSTSAIKTVGLCHEMFGVRRVFAQLFDAPPAAVDLRVAGINHLTWLLAATANGEDLLGRWRDFHAAGGDVPVPTAAESYRQPFVDDWRIKRALFDTYGALPAAGDRHVAEFFAGFLGQAGAPAGAPRARLTTIADREAIAAAARSRVDAWLAGAAPLPTGRSEEEVTTVVHALATGQPALIVANLPNIGQIDNLPRSAIVETRAVVAGPGIEPVCAGDVPPGLLDTLHHHVDNHFRIVDAALEGDRSLALDAFRNDPLVPDLDTATRVLDDLLVANRAYLPRFFA